MTIKTSDDNPQGHQLNSANVVQIAGRNLSDMAVDKNIQQMSPLNDEQKWRTPPTSLLISDKLYLYTITVNKLSFHNCYIAKTLSIFFTTAIYLHFLTSKHQLNADWLA